MSWCRPSKWPPAANSNSARAACIRSSIAWKSKDCWLPRGNRWADDNASSTKSPSADAGNWPKPSAPGNALSRPSTSLCKEANVDALQWLEQVQRELRRQKLPPLYVERFLSELSDH